jgi:hypothetical protein
METSEDHSKETGHVLGLLASQYEKVLGSWEEVYEGHHSELSLPD